MIRFLVVSSLLAGPAFAAQAENAPPPPAGSERPSPPPAEGPYRGDKGKGEWRGGPGGMSGFSRPPGSRHDGFDQLPEAEKRRVREALDKVWVRPEVIQARDRAMKANEDFRDAIRVALQSIDPEAVKIMDRVRPPDHFDPRQMPKLPPAESEDFPRVALQRMGMEFVGFVRPDRREEAKGVHERVIALPQLKEAYTKLQNSTGEARVQALKCLRDLYREEIGKQFQIRDHRGPEGGDHKGPPGPPPERR
ncbi:MAG TPA: hypothetical protein VD994_03760 [Prosthecobacter sp.]|nr:hypothetical protein [Prosthecobacter sp.]